jgi:hypothetical protein
MDSEFGHGSKRFGVDEGDAHVSMYNRGSGSGTSIVPNLGRGAKLILGIMCTIGIIAIISLFMGLFNSFGLTQEGSRTQSLMERFGVFTGFVKAHVDASRHYTFLHTYDSRTLGSVLDSRDLLSGLPTGAPPSIIKGWLNLVLASEAYGSAAASVDSDGTEHGSVVSYNITVVHPDKNAKFGVTALSLAVLYFSMKNETLSQRASVTLCGGNSGTPCAVVNAAGARRDLYTASAVLPDNFDAIATGDPLHTMLMLLVYMGNTTAPAPLAREHLKFAIELEN